MTQDKIIRSPLGREQLVALAREAGMTVFVIESLERFFNKAFAAGAANEREKWEQALPIAMDAMMLQEREACAKVCEPVEGSAYELGVYKTMQTLAAAIRARGETK